MEHATTFIILAGVLGLFMAWGIGANDVANAMATSVGSRAITIKQAIVIAAIFEFAGAVLAGGQVTKTIRKGIIDPEMLSATPELLVYGMLASLVAAGIWLFIASRAGWPVSTTHTIVGAIVGFAVVGIGVDSVNWGKVQSIALSWVISPVMSGIISYILFRSVQKYILNTDNPIVNAKKYVPYYVFIVGFIMSLVTLLKGLKHVGLDLTGAQAYMIAAIIGLSALLLSKVLISKLHFDPKADSDFQFTNVEKIFGVLMMITACAMAFAHGSNDVANAIGPVAAVVNIAQSGEVAQKANLPLWVLALGGVGIVIGLMTYGKRVIQTVGNGITQLTPSRGFAATLGAAVTVVLASGTGLPISTTHTLVGAVVGVGIARGIDAINLKVVSTIFISWVITLPAGALLSIMFFFMFKGMFFVA
jgi:PiT family inorganic phosphate transporter